MPGNLPFAAIGEKLILRHAQNLPTVGAEALEDGVVRADAPSDLFGCPGVELGIEGERHIDDAATRGADDMRMRFDGTIEAAAARRFNRENLPGIGQEIEVAVDRTAADFVILRAHSVVDLFGGGMVVALAHGIKN